MKRKDEETSLANGELWETFKKTLYYEELERFANEKIRELRDMIVQSSMDGKYEEARDLAQKLAGFKLLIDFIDDSIATRVESLEYDREQKDFEKQLPHRL